jgi:hypothetical protein
MYFAHHIQQTAGGGHTTKEVRKARPTKLKIESISEDEDALAAVPTTKPFTSEVPTKGKRAKPIADDSDNDGVQEVSAPVGTKCTRQMTVSYGAPDP